jgi:hypothetical protein
MSSSEKSSSSNSDNDVTCNNNTNPSATTTTTTPTTTVSTAPLTKEARQAKLNELRSELHSTQAEMASLHEQLGELSTTFRTNMMDLIGMVQALDSKGQVQTKEGENSNTD